MKDYEGMKLQLHAFLTLALDGFVGQFHVPAALHTWKEPPVPSNRRVGRGGGGIVEIFVKSPPVNSAVYKNNKDNDNMLSAEQK